MKGDSVVHGAAGEWLEVFSEAETSFLFLRGFGAWLVLVSLFVCIVLGVHYKTNS